MRTVLVLTEARSHGDGATEKDLQLATNDSRDAIFHQSFAEIQQVPKLQARQAEVCEYLLGRQTDICLDERTPGFVPSFYWILDNGFP